MNVNSVDSNKLHIIRIAMQRNNWQDNNKKLMIMITDIWNVQVIFAYKRHIYINNSSFSSNDKAWEVTTTMQCQKLRMLFITNSNITMKKDKLTPNNISKRILNITFLSPPPGMWSKKSNDPHFDRALSRKCSVWFSIYTPINYKCSHYTKHITRQS